MAPKRNQLVLNKNTGDTADPPAAWGKVTDVQSDDSNPSSPKGVNFNPSAFATLPTESATLNNQFVMMAKTISYLKKTVEDKDFQIAQLMSKLEYVGHGESSNNNGPASAFIAKERHADEAPPKQNLMQRPGHSTTSIATLSVQQLQDMITNTIRAQYGGPSQSSLVYSKPYTKRIDELSMPMGYQPPKLQQFDGKGNPKQQVAHFVETCNNAGTDGNLLVKQFVLSLKGNAFNWYIDLEPESIDSWDEMEREFLNRFYSTRRTVSMIELTNTKQWKDEPVVDYINCWRTLSLSCKDKLSEISAIEMCIQGMHWGLLYILQGIKPRNFEELATRAHDMELSIASHKSGFPIDDQKKEKKDSRRNEKSDKASVKESMAIKTTDIKFPSTNKKAEKVEDRRIPNERRRPTLKEMQEKEYPFPDSDVPHIFDELLARKLIELPEPKRPEEAGRVDDPKYCKYHRVVSHPIEKYFVIKEKIMSLARDDVIALDTDDTADANFADVVAATGPTYALKGQNTFLEETQPPKEVSVGSTTEAEDSTEWILVTRRQRQKQHVHRFHPLFLKDPQLLKCPKLKPEGKLRPHCTNLKSSKDPKRNLLTLGDFLPTTFFKHKSKPVITPFHEKRDQQFASCCATIAFTDEDLLLGSMPHNRPLFVSGFMNEQKVNRILIDGGSAIGVTVEELSRSHLTIQGFDQGSQRTIRMIRLDLTIGELIADILFHVIDARTSYHLLLGRPWLHENGVVPSTLHQCFKYSKNGEIVKVDADTKPLTESESHFADAKLYLNSDPVREVLPAKVLTCLPTEAKGVEPAILEISHTESRRLPVTKAGSGEAERTRQEKKKAASDDHQVIKNQLVVPIVGLGSLTPNKSLSPSIHQKIERAFDLKAYDLLARSGYDFSSPSRLGELKAELTGEKIHGLNKGQQRLRNQGFRVDKPKTGMGFMSVKPIRIRVTKKVDSVNVQHIAADKDTDDKGFKRNNDRVSVFNRLGTTVARPSVFQRLGGVNQVPSTCSRLNMSHQLRGSVFDRLENCSDQQSRKRSSDEETCVLEPEEEIQTFSLSQRSKAKPSIVLINMDRSLKVKRRIIKHSGN
ncbi:hypothetical protein CDL12_26634 [Handroanthus impetiginosus]|uniref:Retrotransposon gag domain-containing protein n=1 Tax=Handroanthus impetiginosus TaxID=429701 RepID=A0A2G9G6E0_9LAMI|nr:hypothetical protein CDL12_26634 [Handroanthus impetiginosus]